MAEKKAITKEIHSISMYDFIGPIGSVIDSLIAEKENAEEDGYFDVTIEDHVDWDETSFTLEGSRLETDKEFEKRLAKDKKQREKNKKIKEERKEKEKKEYERLKKKYDKTD